jgi:hypothetical protein
MNKQEVITIEVPGEFDTRDEYAWVCICGNTPVDQGFFGCNLRGDEMEPDIGSDWPGTYCCYQCGRIIKADTREVIGNRKSK